MHPLVEQEIETVRADRTHGASWLARRALAVVGRAIALEPDASAGEVVAIVRETSRRLIEARPGMAPVRNWLERLQADARLLAAQATGPQALRAAMRARVRELVRRAEAAGELAARGAASRMRPGERVFTASFSATVVRACQLAWQAGKLGGVLAAESRAPDGVAYGNEVRRLLSAAGTPVAVAGDAELASQVGLASLVLIGADSVLRDGSVLNGTPTLALARAARAASVPVWVVCEAAKLDHWTDPATLHPELGFDLVPPELVDVVITEEDGSSVAASRGHRGRKPRSG